MRVIISFKTEEISSLTLDFSDYIGYILDAISSACSWAPLYVLSIVSERFTMKFNVGIQIFIFENLFPYRMCYCERAFILRASRKYTLISCLKFIQEKIFPANASKVVASFQTINHVLFQWSITDSSQLPNFIWMLYLNLQPARMFS